MIGNHNKKLFVVDNFYENPDYIRNMALCWDFSRNINFYKGHRTTNVYRPLEIKEAFESIIGEKINNWENHGFNGCFQITTAEDPQVYHCDSQKWAAMIYLSPNAPTDSGTWLLKEKTTGATHRSDKNIEAAFSGGFLDSTRFEILDRSANLYNRLTIVDAGCIHSAGPYFGTDMNSGRLIHLFFFD